MGLIAEFQVNSPDLPLTGAVAAVPEITVYIDRILVDDPDRPVVLCRAVDDADDEFGPALEDDPTVETHTAVDGAGGGSTHRIRLRDPPLPIYRKYVELGTTPLGGIVTVDGWWARAPPCPETEYSVRIGAERSNSSDLLGNRRATIRRSHSPPNSTRR